MDAFPLLARGAIREAYIPLSFSHGLSTDSL